jgi:hypothetical protein
LLPDGYRGWVIIQYEVRGQPELVVDKCKHTIKIPASGVFKTSSVRKIGYGVDRYFLVSSTGTKQAIPDRNSADSDCIHRTCILDLRYFSRPSKTTLFFVGTKPEMESSKYPKIPEG